MKAQQENKTASGNAPKVKTHGDTCECSDPRCPACDGQCRQRSNIILFRSDMEDQTGTAFCEACADDAFDSGLFYDGSADQDETD